MILGLSSLIPAISFILYILFTIFGLAQYRKEKICWPFILYMAAMSVWSFGSFLMHANTHVMTPLFWNRFMVAGMLGGPITIFHSMLYLSAIRRERYRPLIILGYALYGFLLFLNFRGSIVTAAWFEGDRFSYTLGQSAMVAYALSYLFILGGIIHLLLEIIRTQNQYDRKKLRLPLYGAFIMLIGVLGNLYPPIGQYPVDLFAATINAFLIFYAVYRYRLVHYSALVLKAILYFVLVIVSAFVFYGISWLASKAIRTIPFEYSFFSSLLLGAVAAVIFQPMRRGALSVMEKVYFGKRSEHLKSLRTFSSSMTSIVELEQLGESTIKKIVDTFSLEWAVMFVLDYSSRNYRPIAVRGSFWNGHDMRKTVLGRETPFFKSLSGRDGFLVGQLEAASFILDFPGHPAGLSPSLILALRFQTRLNGCIVLGRCQDKEFYDQFDLEALEVLAGECSVSLENAISFERLKRQQKQLQIMNEELTVSRNKLKAFFDGIATPISIQDINYNIIATNIASVRYFGRSFNDVIGEKCYAVFFQRNKPCPGCMAQDCLHAQIPFNMELKDEQRALTFSLQFYPINATIGQEAIFLEFFQDITVEKRLQSELAQSERLANIGILASGIAHEINNPLYGIIGTAEIMLEKLSPDTQLHDYAKDIIQYSQNAAEVIREMSQYTRKEASVLAPVDIIETLETSLKMAQRGMRVEGIRVRKEYGQIPPLIVNRNELQQVFLNLMINAIQAMGQEGALTLQCRMQAGNAIITVKDTGHGIEEKFLDKVFTPFFTTKEPGKGTGLGLSITQRIVHNMGGRIRVESKVGVGSEFIVILPITNEDKNRISFVHVKSPQESEDVFYLQRKILVGEKGYMEESIRRREDESAYHILAYKGLQPVGTVSCLTPERVDRLPIEGHISFLDHEGGKRFVEIDRLAVQKEDRGSIVPLGLMTLAYLYSKSEKAERLLLDVFSDEEKLIQMYRKLGFQTIGEYKDPLPVTVMLLEYETDYEKKSRRMEFFVKPFLTRLMKRLNFEGDEKERFDTQIDKLLSPSIRTGNGGVRFPIPAVD